MTKINAKLTISVVNLNQDDEYVEVCIADEDTCDAVIVAKISTTDFARAVIGRLARVSIESCEVNAKHVGTKRESMALVLPLTDDAFYNREVAIREIEKHCPEGWEPSLYLGSQNSFFSHGGQKFVRTTAYRYVPREDA